MTHLCKCGHVTEDALCDQCVRETLETAETERDEVRRENERLRAALMPFAKAAEGIPENWPSECHLRVEHGRDRDGAWYEWWSYWGIGPWDLGDNSALLPTIAQWREAAKAGKEDTG